MKILVVRFSSIGDIVLTTPVVRALKQQLPNATIHFLTKKQVGSILIDNPFVDRVITIQRGISEVIDVLNAEHYDYIIDLHNNLRTLQLKLRLRRPSLTFPKVNSKKWLLVRFKINVLPQVHVVDRYFSAVKSLNVRNDLLPCEFHIPADSIVDVEKSIGLLPKSFVAIAIGAQFFTKRMPFNKLIEVIEQVNTPIVLLGGEMDTELANKVCNHFQDKQIHSACGGFSLAQSASIVQQAAVLLTNDTGMMHIASCYEVPTISVWGNTVPSLGMYPYFPQHPERFSMHEVANLSCRPCSKIGFQQCPKKHFNCMQLQDSAAIAEDINGVLKSV
jgi:ADP-heptose:LPS heptosyltransferase